MIALILARGGSKGVPKKNVKELNGIPLIFYPIDAANKSNLISSVFVSTDDEEISEISKKYGATVIDRPPNISGDKSLDIDAFIHFCSKLSHTEPIVHLRATTPILDPKVIDEAINQFETNKNYITSLRSGHKTSESAFKYFVKGEKYWEPIIKGTSVDGPRQGYPETYIPNGYVDIVRPDVFMNEKSLHGDKIFPFITDFAPEIDTIDDFYYIEYLMNKNV